jgi:hypothetical protein
VDKALATKADIMSDVADMRYTPLGKLARGVGGIVDESLRHVLPSDAGNRVSVAEFGSCV